MAAALIHRPRLLVLDERTIGLDMISKERLRHFLLAERKEFGTTLLLTTPDMGDIERLCERVLVVDRGRLVFDGGCRAWLRRWRCNACLSSTCPSRVPTSTWRPQPISAASSTASDNALRSARSRQPPPESWRR